MSPRLNSAVLGKLHSCRRQIGDGWVSWKSLTDNPSCRAALCQIFDSIYLDIPMGRVKFNVNTEYAYLQNFKILQSTSYLCPSPPSAALDMTNN